MKNEKLKPCPFCGGEAVIYHQSSKYTEHDGNYVYCMNCRIRTPLFICFGDTGKTYADTKAEAFNAWNRRAAEEKHGEWIEAEDDLGYTVYKCSNCKEEFVIDDCTPKEIGYNYCPSCGARMDGDGK